MSSKAEKTDGRGLVSAPYISEDRDITREDWIRDVFPEWSTFLNKQIDETVISKGTVGLWWFGGPSWAVKTSGGEVFLVDNYAGPSCYTTYDY